MQLSDTMGVCIWARPAHQGASQKLKDWDLVKQNVRMSPLSKDQPPVICPGRRRRDCPAYYILCWIALPYVGCTKVDLEAEIALTI